MSSLPPGPPQRRGVSGSVGAEAPAFVCEHLPAGTRLGLAVSGGADSVALLRLAAGLADVRGWALTVLHVEHGLRGDAARADAGFVEELAAELGVPFLRHAGDAAALATQTGEGLEAAGRTLRYGWFAGLLSAGRTEAHRLDAIATGHTLDDQAETVLGKLLRGGWTRGLAGIHPVVAAADLPGGPAGALAGVRGAGGGILVRPLLAVRRAALRSWLGALGQTWREDASNADPAFTRNRIRQELLPSLRGFTPQVDEALAQTATLARADEEYWQAEVARVMPGLLLPGRPVRGGGRASSTLGGERSLAFEVERLWAFPAALRGRLLRAAAAQLGARVDFRETALLLALCEGPAGSTARRAQLGGAGLRAERTARELRLVLDEKVKSAETAEVVFAVPGTGTALGVRVTVSYAEPNLSGSARPDMATLRAAAPGDRVRLRYSSGAPKRIKEVLERRGVLAGERAAWPVLVYAGEIVWMQGAALEPSDLSRQLVIAATAEEA